MMRITKVLLLVGFVLHSILGFSQKTSISKGQAKIRVEKDWTENQVIAKARESAIINAIENAFGSVVVEGNTLYVKNEQSGKANKSDIVFNSISNILVNGEWIKTVEEKYTFTVEEDYRWILFNITGEVRELKKIPFSPEVHTLTCNQLKCSTEVFNSGQELILYFKAPKDGFVAVYLDDNQQTQKLLPYTMQANQSTFSVEADKEYYFFYSDKKNQNGKVDEIELFTDKKIEQNRMFVLYSESDFSKPILSETTSNQNNELYKLPPFMASGSFQLWLQKTRSYNKQIELNIVDVSIKCCN
jgi:hypothetical protein